MLSMPGVTKPVLVVTSRVDRIARLAPPEVPVYVAPLDLMRHVAGFTVHRGVLAIGYRSAIERSDLASALCPDGPLTVLLCENITNIDNIGLLFRNAAAFGVDGILLSPRCHDPLYRKSLRVSIGHALTVPFVRSRDWPGDLGPLKARHPTSRARANTQRAAASSRAAIAGLERSSISRLIAAADRARPLAGTPRLAKIPPGSLCSHRQGSDGSGGRFAQCRGRRRRVPASFQHRRTCVKQ
ncbi:MAG: hypothetical protein IH983_01340 [Planctomycetes bacterium]|nr:hypothetical protein [Planctomycetota bacterium]